MNRTRKLEIFAILSVATGVVAAILSSMLSRPDRVTVVTGAVLRDAAEPKNQQPIQDAAIIVSVPAQAEARSDASGFFRLALVPGVIAGQTLKLRVEHPEYRALAISVPAGDELRLVRLTPKVREPDGVPSGRVSKVADIRMRYALKMQSVVNVGSAARAFEVVNTGNVPCNGQPPCSPDGKWRAKIGSISLDAGERNEFRNARLSCIAGPCPFSKPEDELPRNGRVIKASVRNWSDTVTYLLEAEVTNTRVSDRVHFAYPAIFGESMNFTLPATAKGLSIEAEMDGAEIVYPLGPNLTLSWASCSVTVASDQTSLYRCEIKPGFAFGG
jgi:hypothetical protein